MKILQEVIILTKKQRGFHLINDEIIDSSKYLEHVSLTGIVHVFLMHTSASLSLGENADSTVRADFETFTNDLIPESYPKFIHTFEGTDDMPAHIKSALYGNSLTIPMREGKLLLGTWQGIYLNEHRTHAHARSIALTIMGQ